MTTAVGYGPSIAVTPTTSQIIVTHSPLSLVVTGSAQRIVVTQNLFTDTQ